MARDFQYLIEGIATVTRRHEIGIMNPDKKGRIKGPFTAFLTHNALSSFVVVGYLETKERTIDL